MKYLIKTLAVLALVLGMFTACAASTSDAGDTKVKDQGQTAAPADTETSYEPDTEVPEPEPAPDPKHHLVKSDLSLKTKIREMQCFGSAGCSGEVDITLGFAIANPGKLDGDYDVTYRITGSEDGPIIGTLTVYANGKYDKPYPQSVYPPSSATPINIAVTSVSKV